MEGNVITLQDIFIFKQEGFADGKVLGRYMATGFVPKFVQTLQARGIALPKGLFARPQGDKTSTKPPAGRPPRGRR